VTNRDLAQQLQRDQVLARRALAALMLNELSEQVARACTKQSTTAPDTSSFERGLRQATELVLVPTDGSEPLWLARVTW
jgi:hypothetical protein